ncbi:MAG: hypothetical protein EOP24_26690 [Hyphomicrobiales bacterium]|nr:MAG: hypothetical protein EOP24_26690 [Hyphomicrobiales bacterium]
MTVPDAIYHTVHNYPGGVAALAARMGVSANTLTHKANPNNTTHHLHPAELLALQYMSGNAAVLHAMAAALGYSVTRATPDQTGGNPLEATMRLQCEFADLMRAAADPLRRTAAEPAKAVTGTEVRRVEFHAQETTAAIDCLVATMRAQRPGGPASQA